jgi:hypothetical protein
MINSLFLRRTLKQMSYQNLIPNNHNIDYSLNEDGYRTKNFKNNEDLLALGCSQTFGWGVNIDQTWPEIFAKNNNISVTNISLPGDSAQGQVTKAFEYFKRYGNPKIVIGVFPAYRIEFPIVEKFWSHGDENTSTTKVAMIDVNENFEKISKAPYKIEDIMLKEMATFYTHTFINILEQYCISNNIKFLYNIWHKEYNEYPLKDIMMRHSKSYFPIEIVRKNCHIEFSDKKYFNCAADYENKDRPGHWSYHDHIHISDSIEQYIKEE